MSGRVRTALRGAAAGASAAAVWLAVEPVLARAMGTGYTDARLLGRVLSERHPRAVGVTVHTMNGAVFGAVFALAGGRGARAGAAAATVENILAWPGMALMDRIHPDRKSGDWGRLLTDGRIFAQETAVHVLFGALLGLQLPPDDAG